MASPDEQEARWRRLWREAARTQEFWLVVALVTLCGVFSLWVPGFFDVRTLRSVALQSAVEGIIAVGMTMVIISGGIDLSVGSLLAAAGMTCTLLMSRGMPVPAAIACTLALGAVVGAFNGALVAYVRIPPFVVTLAMLSMARGYAMLLTDSASVSDYPKAFNVLGSGTLLWVPVPVWLLAAVFAAGYVVLRHTRFGRHVYAVGGNAEAARLAGVPVRRTLVLVYCTISTLAALAGMIHAGRLGAGVPKEGQGAELNVIAAVVLGGTSLMGGEGSLLGTLIGVFVIGFLNKGLGLQGIGFFWQLIIIGGVILAAVGLNQVRRRLR
ncbi:MAG: ABC transporter permease [Planctomycetota bacterium]